MSSCVAVSSAIILVNFSYLLTQRRNLGPFLFCVRPSCLFELHFAFHFSLVSLLSLKCFSFLNDVDFLLQVQEKAQIVWYALRDSAKVVYALTELRDSSCLAVCINVFSVHQLLDAMLGSISVGSSWTDSLIILNRIKQDWILAQSCFVFDLFSADYASRFVVAPIFVIFQISGKLFWLEQPKITTEVTEKFNWVALCSRWLLVITQEICQGGKSHNLPSVWNKTQAVSQHVPGKDMQSRHCCWTECKNSAELDASSDSRPLSLRWIENKKKI